MQDIQKKLDELISLRDKLVELIDADKLTDVFTIKHESIYAGKIQEIAKKHRRQIKETNAILTNSSFEVRRLANESRRLANESRRLANDSIKKFNNQNKITSTQSIDLIKILIDRIKIDINDSSIELKKLITLDEIRKLSETNEYIQLFLKKYLIPGSRRDVDVELISLIIKSYCDWHYPGLQINPKSTDWVNCMVASDPLYLIKHNKVYTNDNDETLYLTPGSMADIIANYPKEYQRRLRIYDVDQQDFSALPQEQFGCIACCDFLNFFSLNKIENYLITFFNLLKPGGNIICTLNLTHSNEDPLVEETYFAYAAELVVQKLFNDIGFKINSINNLTSDLSWECNLLITAQKPGILTTTKAHQVLGSIIEK